MDPALDMDMVKHPTLGISAPAGIWRAAGYALCEGGELSSIHAPHGFDRLLLRSLVHVPDDEPGAVRIAWALDELARESAERTRVTAESRLADAIRALADTLGRETAESLIARMPDRLRSYVQAVATRR